MVSVKLSAEFWKYSVVVNEMNVFKICGLAICVLVANGCSTSPVKSESVQQGADTALAVSNARTQAVAKAGIGVPQVYKDELSGKSVELVVESEYFSANGRLCRRFTEFVAGRDVAGVGCQDEARGWIEIPLSSVVR